MNVGENLKRIRKKKKVTQQQLADSCGLNVATIRGYEAGKYNPKYETILVLARALGVETYDLMEGSLQLKKDGSYPLIKPDKKMGELLYNYRELNDAGKEVAADILRGLTALEKYRNKESET